MKFLEGQICGKTIAGFLYHTIIKTLQQKSRMKEIKEDEYSNSLVKTQVCVMFRVGDIRKNVLLKYIRLCLETPCLCPSDGHKYGERRLTKTCHLVLLQKAHSGILRADKHPHEYLFSFKDCSDWKISADKSLFLTHVTAFSAASLIMSRKA